MKFTTVLAVLVPAVLALPTSSDAGALGTRQTAVSIVDSYLFSITLPAFTAKRNAKNPSTLDWTSDGCSDSPDNPFGFPFVPACNRHDFGYQNYRLQNRFTKAAKAKIDTNFKADLYYQCKSVTLTGVCNALADVYYAAVKAFGGGDATKRDEQADLVREYEEKLAIYNQLVAEKQATGELWTPN
ncbi:prokaryotic phospholipase A2-domain-containing protein [Podospora didyma]|uniref:Prokaryotic phospholipase A2-domain-containing protein n=1 Tax=Podospora didyma TaxID=330526 RepID=A0AAE0KAV4_9PEZI|nr:prokaryotic phospholipase A2-domain-containing protein [Podospora didyma]